MALIRWEPALDLQGLQRDFNRLLGSAFDSHTVADGARGAVRRWTPAVDLVESEESYILRADLPGVAAEDVKVELNENVLRVSGERVAEHEDRGSGYQRIERVSGAFSRALRLPEGVDPESIEANFEQGVLEVRVPKPQRRKPVQVAINLTPKKSTASPDSDQQEQS